MSNKNSSNNNIFVKIMAAVLAFLMIGSVGFTVVYYLIQMYVLKGA